MLSRQKYLDFFSEASGTTLHRVFPVKRCPKSIKTTLNRFFPVHCCLEPQGQHCIGFLTVNVVPAVLRQHCTGFFPVQCLELVESDNIVHEHITRVSSVSRVSMQCCP